MIALIDCNNFFVSCERLFRPDLHHQPVAVLSSNDGCIVARSDEVKKIGIPMGVPLFKVKDVVRKHGITLFSSNFTLYRDLSRRVMAVLCDEYRHISVYSIDEAFVTLRSGESEDDVRRVRDRIMKHVGIPVSIGVASTHTLAKLASTYAKRGDGVFYLDSSFLRTEGTSIPVGTIWGIGREMAAMLTRDGVHTLDEFIRRGIPYARSTCGVHGERIVYELMGKSTYRLGAEDAVEASIASTRSFRQKTHEKDVIMGAIASHVAHIGEKLREREHMACGLTVMASPGRHSAYAQRKGSASSMCAEPTDSTETLLKMAQTLFLQIYDADVPYKKAGAVVHSIIPRAYASPNLLTGDVREKSAYVYDVVDALNARLGPGTLQPGAVLGQQVWDARRENGSPAYTTRWRDIPTVKAV